MIIDGKKIASDVLGRLKKMPKPAKFLAAVLVGNDPASENFVKQKEKIAIRLGVDFRILRFSNDIAKNMLCEEVKRIADDPMCGGVIVQLPLPDRTLEQEVLNIIPSPKDIDVLGQKALVLFYAGENDIFPPAVGTVLEILNSYFPTPIATFRFLVSSTIVIVGAGRLVGQPVMMWLKGKAKEVIVLDKGDELDKLKNADLIVCGAGAPGLITPSMLKDGAIIIDFGYGMRDGKVMGDFDASQLDTRNSQLINYTPTPGGTGPVLVVKLFENFYKLNGL